MKPEEFEAEDWIERLAQTLSELAEGHETSLRKYHGLAPDIHLLFGGPEGGRHTYSPDQVWGHFAMQARQGRWNWAPRRAESQPPKASKPDGVRSILLAHPTLAEASDSMAGRDEFWVQGLGTGRSTSLTDLIAGLMARAAELSGDRFRAAAGELSALLAPATGTGPARVSAGPDVGCDVVLFYGLTLEEESDLADGMAIVPFERVRAFVDEELVQELAPAGAEVHGWPSVGAIVRPFRWKPSFRRTGDLEDAGSNPPGRFSQDAQTFLELISVAHGAPVLRLADLSNCIDRSAGRLLGLERRGPGLYRSWSAHEFDGLADRPRLAREALDEAREAFGKRTTGHHEAMAPIVSRLAEAQARSGRFAGDDMILDSACERARRGIGTSWWSRGMSRSETRLGRGCTHGSAIEEHRARRCLVDQGRVFKQAAYIQPLHCRDALAASVPQERPPCRQGATCRQACPKGDGAAKRFHRDGIPAADRGIRRQREDAPMLDATHISVAAAGSPSRRRRLA